MVYRYCLAFVGGLFLISVQLESVVSYSSWNKPGSVGKIVVVGVRHDFDTALSKLVHEKIVRLNTMAEAGALGDGRLHHLVELCNESPYAFQLLLSNVDPILRGMLPYFLAESPEQFQDHFNGDALLRLYETQHGKKPEKYTRVAVASVDSRGAFGIAFQYLKAFMSKKKMPNVPFYEESACDQLQFFAQNITLATIFNCTQKIEKYELAAEDEPARDCFRKLGQQANAYSYHAWQEFSAWAVKWSIDVNELEDIPLVCLIPNSYEKSSDCLIEFEACLLSDYLKMALKTLVDADALSQLLQLAGDDNAIVWVGALHAVNIENNLEGLGFVCADDSYRIHYNGAIARTVRDTTLALPALPLCCVPSNFVYSILGRNGYCAHCAIIQREKRLLSCSRCGTVSYCSKACQKTDWQLHKSMCVKK